MSEVGKWCAIGNTYSRADRECPCSMGRGEARIRRALIGELEKQIHENPNLMNTVLKPLALTEWLKAGDLITHLLIKFWHLIKVGLSSTRISDAPEGLTWWIDLDWSFQVSSISFVKSCYKVTTRRHQNNFSTSKKLNPHWNKKAQYIHQMKRVAKYREPGFLCHRNSVTNKRKNMDNMPQAKQFDISNPAPPL